MQAGAGARGGGSKRRKRVEAAE